MANLKSRTFKEINQELFKQKVAIKPIENWHGDDFVSSRFERILDKNWYKQYLRGNNPSV